MLDFGAFAYAGAVKRLPPPLASPAQRHRSGTSAAASRTDVAPDRGNAEAPTEPYIASGEGRWRERYASVSLAAFLTSVQCTAHDERPLRCLLVGHNPSEHAWASGVGYSNPTNRFWGLLRDSGVLPQTWRPGGDPRELNNNMPGELGIGITDYILAPGSDAAKFSRARMLSERSAFHRRLAAHAARAGAPPRIIVFVGKRQWAQQFEPPLAKVAAGWQRLRPPGWPFPPEEQAGSTLQIDGTGRAGGGGSRGGSSAHDATASGDDASPSASARVGADVVGASSGASTEEGGASPLVFVLTSPSGRAVVPPAERMEEYRCFARALHALAWPAAEPAVELD